MQVNLHFVQCRAISRRLLAVGYQLPEVRSQQPEADSRKPSADSRQPIADSRQPEAGSLHYALAPLSRGGWRAPIYSLAPHCLSGGRGPRSGEGGLPKARRKPIASSRKPAARSRKSALRPCPPLSRGGWRAPIYSLAPHCLSGGRGPRSGEGGIAEGTPGAGSLHYALAHPCPRVGGERLYTLLRPTACQGGEGHAVARGGLPKARREPEVCTTPLHTPVQG